MITFSVSCRSTPSFSDHPTQWWKIIAWKVRYKTRGDVFTMSCICVHISREGISASKWAPSKETSWTHRNGTQNWLTAAISLNWLFSLLNLMSESGWNKAVGTALLCRMVCAYDVMSWTRPACVAVVSITSWANPLLLFIGGKPTNMAVPQAAQIQKEKKKNTKKEVPLLQTYW